MTREEKNHQLALYCSGTTCAECKVKSSLITPGSQCIVFSCRSDDQVNEDLIKIGIDPVTGKLLNAAQEETSDVVNHPQHYELPGGLECIDAMVATQGRLAVMAFCKCNAFKYLWRHERKKKDEDLEKARWYLNKWHDLREEERGWTAQNAGSAPTSSTQD